MQNKNTSREMIMITVLALFFAVFMSFNPHIYAQPFIRDTSLKVDSIVEGLSSPTSMAFLDNNNILVLEKEGNIRLVSDGILQEDPVLQVLVNQDIERGLLGIAIMNGSTTNTGQDRDIFLFYTEADPLRDRVYKYRWNGQSLVNPTLILDLPAEPWPNHHGGKLLIGPDGYLYAVIGDLNHQGQLQNFRGGSSPDDTGVIFRVNPGDGSALADNPYAYGNEGEADFDLLSRYYAYGVRNSFGMDFDPVTGNLWNTENGDKSYDEINLVKPGFNSGWKQVMGPIALNGGNKGGLVNFPGSHYADPLFSWQDPVAPTDLEFFSSSRLGDEYTNSIFVGDITRGNLYFFEVNGTRDGIKLDSVQQREAGLTDFVVDNEEELSAVTFGREFGGITEIETGPDGFLYVLSFENGIIYKISK